MQALLAGPNDICLRFIYAVGFFIFWLLFGYGNSVNNACWIDGPDFILGDHVDLAGFISTEAVDPEIYLVIF